MSVMSVSRLAIVSCLRLLLWLVVVVTVVAMTVVLVVVFTH